MQVDDWGYRFLYRDAAGAFSQANEGYLRGGFLHQQEAASGMNLESRQLP